MELSKIATVRFVRSDVADEFGFFGYEFADMEMFATPTHSFKVTLPASSKLYCNGKEVSAEKKTAEEPHPFNQFLPKGLDVEGVTMVTYEASGLFLEPEMRAVDRDLIPHVLTFLEDEGLVYQVPSATSAKGFSRPSTLGSPARRYRTVTN